MAIAGPGLWSLEILKQGVGAPLAGVYTWSNRYLTKVDSLAIGIIQAKALAQREMHFTCEGISVVAVRVTPPGVDTTAGTVEAYDYPGQLLVGLAPSLILFNVVRMRWYVDHRVVGYRHYRVGCADVHHVGGVWTDAYRELYFDNLFYALTFHLPLFTVDGKQVTSMEPSHELVYWPIRHGSARAARTYWAP